MKPKLYDALTTLTVRSCTILPPSRAHRICRSPWAHPTDPSTWAALLALDPQATDARDAGRNIPPLDAHRRAP